MKRDIKKAIKEYQCSGCVSADGFSCYEKNDIGVSCGKHVAGTMISNIGSIFLGLPTGFNRLGPCKETRITIFEADNPYQYDKFNIPVWKYKNENGDVLVRGIMPRVNYPFVHIILQGGIKQINCLEITDKDIEEMD